MPIFVKKLLENHGNNLAMWIQFAMEQYESDSEKKCQHGKKTWLCGYNLYGACINNQTTKITAMLKFYEATIP